MDEWILTDVKEIHKGPSIENWGTPFDAVGKKEESNPANWAHCVLADK